MNVSHAARRAASLFGGISRIFPLAAAFAVAMLLSRSAAATTPNCTQIAAGPLVYATGSSAAKPFLAELAKSLYNDVASPITIVYQPPGSCTGVDAILLGTPMTGMATYWNASRIESQCNITGSVNGGVLADIGISDVFATTCRSLPNGVPSGVKDFFGPIQTMTFVVPKASPQVSISGTAAYFVYGFGADSGVPPWTDGNFIFSRTSNSGTLRLLGQAIGVDPAKWKGVPLTSTADMLAHVKTSTSPEATIGVLAATDIGDADRSSVTVLAYRHFDQTCGYYPDSTSTARDKRNVRDGHYAPWGPLHFYARVNSAGYPGNVNAAHVINFLTGAVDPPGNLDLVQVEVINNLIPMCAMSVTRATEMGPLTSFAPTNACSCYFEQQATGSTQCTPCTSNGDCPTTARKCSANNFCEAQ